MVDAFRGASDAFWHALDAVERLLGTHLMYSAGTFDAFVHSFDAFWARLRYF